MDASLEVLCGIAATLETNTPFWKCSEMSQSFVLVTVLQQVFQTHLSPTDSLLNSYITFGVSIYLCLGHV